MPTVKEFANQCRTTAEIYQSVKTGLPDLISAVDFLYSAEKYTEEELSDPQLKAVVTSDKPKHQKIVDDFKKGRPDCPDLVSGYGALHFLQETCKEPKGYVDLEDFAAILGVAAGGNKVKKDLIKSFIEAGKLDVTSQTNEHKLIGSFAQLRGVEQPTRNDEGAILKAIWEFREKQQSVTPGTNPGQSAAGTLAKQTQQAQQGSAG